MLVIEKRLFCDHCGIGIGEMEHLHAYKQREVAKRSGWIFLNGRDYCPECESKIKAKNKTEKS